jgi:hypothetical protein
MMHDAIKMFGDLLKFSLLNTVELKSRTNEISNESLFIVDIEYF